MLLIAVKRNPNQSGRKIKALSRIGEGRMKPLRLVATPLAP